MAKPRGGLMKIKTAQPKPKEKIQGVRNILNLAFFINKKSEPLSIGKRLKKNKLVAIIL
jgi:hypothetical protein